LERLKLKAARAHNPTAAPIPPIIAMKIPAPFCSVIAFSMMLLLVKFGVPLRS
jgi:hypothetical protein